MDKKVANIEDKINEKNKELNYFRAKDITTTLIDIVKYKLYLIGQVHSYDDLDLWEFIITEVGEVCADMNIPIQLDRDNPPHLSVIKLYDIICNNVVDKIFNIMNSNSDNTEQ